MLKIVYPICCGIDVHKNFIVATIAFTDSKSITTYQTQRFSTFSKDLARLKHWLSENQCESVCMESTGKYWIPVYNALEGPCRITLAHPKYVKAIRGKKTDKKDSIWIADLFKHDLVTGSFIPPPVIRELRDLLRYKVKLTETINREKNRIQNSLTVSNIMLSSVVSDTFGKSGSAILSHLLENPSVQPDELPSLLHGSVRKKKDEIALALDGTISSPQREKMKLCLDHLHHLQSSITKISALAESLAQPYQNALLLIETVPGIRKLSALAILSEIGADMSVFPSDKHLCSWAGLAPTNDQSAGKKKSVHISRAGIFLKPLLVQCALAAIKCRGVSVFKDRYDRLCKRRGHKRALIAVARMMLTAIWHMLSNGEVFNPNQWQRPALSQVSVFSSEAKAVELLRSLGYSVDKFPEPA